MKTCSSSQLERRLIKALSLLKLGGYNGIYCAHGRARASVIFDCCGTRGGGQVWTLFGLQVQAAWSTLESRGASPSPSTQSRTNL